MDFKLEHLKLALIMKKTTLKEFAESIGVDRSFIYRVLNGQRKSKEVEERIYDLIRSSGVDKWIHMSYNNSESQEVTHDDL